MQHKTLRLATVALLAAPALAETEELFRLDRPEGTWGAWGHSFADLGDLDGDGVADFAIGIQGHGGGPVATVHSGRSGAHLFTMNVPAAPVFWGMGFAPLPDETGDGVSEIIAVGANSGDSNSPNGVLTVFSGADGSIVRRMIEQDPLTYVAHGQANRSWLPDVDDDGSPEIFCRTHTIGLGFGYTLLSTATGEAHYTVVPTAPRVLSGAAPVRAGDLDGDGVEDFGLLTRVSNAKYLEYRSGVDGALIRDEELEGVDQFVGSAPFLLVADLNGDDVPEVATGSDFDGQVDVNSGADGSHLFEWDCDTQPVACFGSRLIELPDFSGDGHPDLLALESDVFGNAGVRLFGVDPVSGEVLFDELNPNLSGGYSIDDRLMPLVGADPDGFPSFLVFEGSADQVVARRILPQQGTRFCPSTPNSSGEAARLRAFGSASLGANDLVLDVVNAPASRPVFFVYGSESGVAPFGNGTLCAAGSIGRVQAVVSDGAGRAARPFDLALLETEVGTTWTFQAAFRDPAGGGAQTSDALAIQLTP